MGSELNLHTEMGPWGIAVLMKTLGQYSVAVKKQTNLLESIRKGLENRAESILLHEDSIHLKASPLYKIQCGILSILVQLTELQQGQSEFWKVLYKDETKSLQLEGETCERRCDGHCYRRKRNWKGSLGNGSSLPFRVQGLLGIAWHLQETDSKEAWCVCYKGNGMFLCFIHFLCKFIMVHNAWMHHPLTSQNRI